jgi:hypothetical protein
MGAVQYVQQALEASRVASVQAVRPESAPEPGVMEPAQQALGAWPDALVQVGREVYAVVSGGAGGLIWLSLGGGGTRVGAWGVAPERVWESLESAVARPEVAPVQALEP